jgi:hypothetical protein
MTPNIPIMAWSPDTDPTVPGVLVDVENLLPTERSYAPDFAIGVSDEWPIVLSGECCGIAGLTYQSTGPSIYAGVGGALYRSNGGGLSDVSRLVGGAYTLVSPGSPWRFASFRDATIAVHAGNAMQATPSNSARFADVTGAPKAATIAVQRNFVVVGDLTDSVSYKPDGWACCALEDYTDWTVDIATQAASGRLTATQGPILRMIPFQDYIIAFKASSFYRGQYVGAASNTWAWPLVSSDIGLVSHDAVIAVEGVLYWMGQDGFYRWAGGGQPQRIASAPWRWLRSVLLSGSSTTPVVQAAWDSVRRCVRWLVYVARSDFSGPYCLAYHIDTDRWGKSDLRVQWAFQIPYSTVASVENTTNLQKANTAGYVDNVSVSVMVHEGSAMSSSFTTGDIGDDDEVFALTRVRTRFLNGTAPLSTAAHFYRMTLGDSLEWGESIQVSDGKYDFSQSARWHRVKFQQTGRYEVVGFRVEVPRAGKR